MGAANSSLEDGCLAIKPINEDSSKKNIIMDSLHVFFRSDIIPKNGQPNENMVGLILYMCNGQTSWYSNGIKCKSGYIIMKKVSNIDHIKSNYGMKHGKLYKYMFGEEPKNGSKGTVAAGFAYYNGEWRFNSCTFNTQSTYDGDSYHDYSRCMSDNEIKCLTYALYNWKYGKQNTPVKDVPEYWDQSYL